MPKSGAFGNFYPVRCLVGERHKLVVNMLDTDEFYDLEKDPFELENRLYERDTAPARDAMHDALLQTMDEITDPLRSYLWGHRRWRSVRRKFFHSPV
jgi:uncharacterized sulfatase